MNPEGFMRLRTWFVIGCFALAIVGGLSRGLAQNAPAAADPNAWARIAIAREMYEQLYDRFLEDMVAPPSGPASVLDPLFTRGRAEEFYLWSRRWMEAERDFKPDRSGSVEALKRHMDRMTKLETGEFLSDEAKVHNKAPVKKDELGPAMSSKPAFATPLKYFRLEAESWLSIASATPQR
jgi:hypothetical protein